MKKIVLSVVALGTTLAVLPMFAAFEAHVINVVAQIENALNVPASHLDFGTVFPQEHLEKNVEIFLSESFQREPRVDDVEYIIRQKPKCGITENNGTVLIGGTVTGHVIPNGQGGYTVDCGDEPILGEEQSFGVLPLLCPYLSKHERTEDGSETDNDGSLPAFHDPFTVDNDTVSWLDVKGRLAKSAQDFDDNWIIDLAVPCFGDHCAQDWADFVHEHNPAADADAFIQDPNNEHKVFGCDLWVEVTEVSESEETPIL